MQKLRAVAVAVIATFVVTAGASAQEMRNFDNSWFWGFKSGINTFSAPGRGNTSTVDMGVDWLITRTKGGLYVSGNQSIFERDISVFDNGAGMNRTVRVNDLRRITQALWRNHTVRGSGLHNRSTWRRSRVRRQRQRVSQQRLPGRG